MIELQAATIKAGDFSLNEISFRIETGEYAVLMGPTGQGKTTILEAICGLRQLARGKIILKGRDVTGLSPAERAIGYVPQDLVLFPTMTVRQQLEFALDVRRVKRQRQKARVEELAELLGISYLLSRKINGLSGGESQRVALGRALSFEPNVLLLDEPLSALDESTRLAMHELLRNVQDQTGVTTLHVTHSQEEADALADRQLILENQEIRERSEGQDSTSDEH
ncbi:MAG: ATP-binding cassette domain-containing protein [Mariniblastus sp.]|nr:ATP-binding cassette domain-containing protein [Mariniblastus sp.]